MINLNCIISSNYFFYYIIEIISLISSGLNPIVLFTSSFSSNKITVGTLLTLYFTANSGLSKGFILSYSTPFLSYKSDTIAHGLQSFFSNFTNFFILFSPLNLYIFFILLYKNTICCVYFDFFTVYVVYLIFENFSIRLFLIFD